MFKLIEIKRNEQDNKMKIEVGDIVRIVQQIVDDGQDHHPACVIAERGDEVVVVRPPNKDGGVALWVRHQGEDREFMVFLCEIGKG